MVDELEQLMRCIVADIASPARNALVGGPFGSDLVSKDYVAAGVPVIRGANMGHGRWVGGEFTYVTLAKAESLSANCAKPGDIVFTQRGTLGQVALVPETGHDRYLISQSQMKLAVDKSKADALFLYYVFTSAEQQDYIRRNAIQTGVPHTNLGVLRNTPLSLPPLAEQRAVASILGALDDKIELNIRMNATLEATARTLFRSWFVDFDPVRAKRDGSTPFCMDEAATQAVPTRLVGSDVGLIPEGWRIGSVGELCNLSRASINPGQHPDETFDHYSLPSFDEGRVPKAERGDQIKSNKLLVQPDSVLLSKLNPHIPRIWLPQLHPTRRSICSTEFIVAQPSKGVAREYLYALFTSPAFASAYGTLVTGTTGSHQRIAPESVIEMKSVLPPEPLIRAFAAAAGPMLAMVNRNITQSRTLAALRDALLPKLLSGELRIPDAIKTIEKVA